MCKRVINIDSNVKFSKSGRKIVFDRVSNNGNKYTIKIMTTLNYNSDYVLKYVSKSTDYIRAYNYIKNDNLNSLQDILDYFDKNVVSDGFIGTIYNNSKAKK